MVLLASCALLASGAPPPAWTEPWEGLPLTPEAEVALLQHLTAPPPDPLLLREGETRRVIQLKGQPCIDLYFSESHWLN